MTRSTVPVRDGLPTSKELTQALAKLQIPLKGSILENMTEDRKVAVLTGILNAWAQAYAMTAIEEAKLGLEEFYLLVESSQSEVSLSPSAPGQAPLIDTNMIVERLRWTEAHLAAVDGFSGRTIADPMRGILQCLIGLVEQWRDSMADPAAQLGDSDTRFADSETGATHVRELAVHIQDLATLMFGTPEPDTGGA
ncbi:hypothetical protein ACH4YO_41685 [Streptomyces noursei]|uniref:hypothetical protein n=1 Tax=Streptomyces noursei TaxID=1971 RepID=UPI00081C6930|nr:hypothetical protein SNOUR_00220 [Streptomyces noursei ATCC 11455]ANZ21968.1 hypothetical protein SNOUR_43730 [Streptomyces noursei ATCC 11455]MCZ0996447.1 hypothetical protein [Streptomyces noursei]